MKLEKLLAEIKRQEEWAWELTRQASPNHQEPADSLRRLLQGDDHRSSSEKS